MKYVLVSIVLIMLLLPSVASAAIVECSSITNPGPDKVLGTADDVVIEQVCNFCDVFVVTKNIFDLLALQIAPTLAVVMFIFGGLLIMFGGGFPGSEQKPGLRARGKRVISGTILGFVIVLLSWVIVSTIINTLTPSDMPEGFPWPWHDPKCS